MFGIFLKRQQIHLYTKHALKHTVFVYQNNVPIILIIFEFLSKYITKIFYYEFDLITNCDELTVFL